MVMDSLNEKSGKLGIVPLPKLPGLNRKKRRGWLKGEVRKRKRQKKEG